jgi:hypothetical protein
MLNPNFNPVSVKFYFGGFINLKQTVVVSLAENTNRVFLSFTFYLRKVSELQLYWSIEFSVLWTAAYWDGVMDDTAWPLRRGYRPMAIYDSWLSKCGWWNVQFDGFIRK